MHAKIRVVVHKAEEGGFWAEVPALPGCFSQADTLPELRRNVQEAVDLYLAAAIKTAKPRTRPPARTTRPEAEPTASKPARRSRRKPGP